MKIEYIGHATLLLEIDGIKLITDPWIEGAAYCDQWHIFPKPLDHAFESLKDADYILLSHGHEDHLHEPTLKKINKNAKVFFPYTWYDDATEYFDYLGFSNSEEVKSGGSVQINKDLKIHYISHNLDSIIIVEYKDEVFVNLNDALHSSTQKVISYFTKKIKSKWNNINYVFCGFGGASYFPNCFHASTKDNEQIAYVRESLFIKNFTQIVYELDPVLAVPFAADFVLLNPETMWINNTRIKRSMVPDLYKEKYPDSKVQICPCYPGDVLDKMTQNKISPYRSKLKNGSLDHLINEQYSSKIEELSQFDPISENEADELFNKFQKHITYKTSEALSIFSNLLFSVYVIDIKDKPYINIKISDNRITVFRAKERLENVDLEYHLRSEILNYSLASEWGGDCITIGYGAQVKIYNEQIIEDSSVFNITKLLTNRPSEKSHLVKKPIRSLKFILANEIHRDFFIKKLTLNSNSLRNQLYVGDGFNNSHWLSKDKCEICKVCAIPDLEEAYFN